MDMRELNLDELSCVVGGGGGASVATENYVPTAGETLTSVSQKFGIPVATLMRINGFQGEDVNIVGKTIKIPTEY